MADEKEIAKDFRSIQEDYAWDPSIFSEEDERVARLKYIINRKLTQPERAIFLLYTEMQSYRKLGERLNISHTTCRTLVEQIKKKILEEYNQMTKTPL